MSASGRHLGPRLDMGSFLLTSEFQSTTIAVYQELLLLSGFFAGRKDLQTSPSFSKFFPLWLSRETLGAAVKCTQRKKCLCEDGWLLWVEEYWLVFIHPSFFVSFCFYSPDR